MSERDEAASGRHTSWRTIRDARMGSPEAQDALARTQAERTPPSEPPWCVFFWHETTRADELVSEHATETEAVAEAGRLQAQKNDPAVRYWVARDNRRLRDE